MTVSSTPRKSGPYACNGVTTLFAVGFKFLADDLLKVILTDTATGVETVLVETTDYTRAGAGDASGGSITTTTTYPTGKTITILGNLDFDQEVDYVEGDPFPAETHEGALDKLTMLNLQQQEELARAVKLKASTAIASAQLVDDPVDGRALIWEGASGDIGNGPTASEISAAQGFATAAAASAATAATAKDDAETARDEAEAFALSIDPDLFVNLSDNQTVGGNKAFTGDNTHSGNNTFSGAFNTTTTATVRESYSYSTETDAGTSAVRHRERFFANNASGNSKEVLLVDTYYGDATDGSEDSGARFWIQKAGVQTPQLTLDGTGLNLLAGNTYKVNNVVVADNDAWTTYTPTVTAASGTFTTVSATGRYKQMGKTIQTQIKITITTVGTASGGISVTLPFTSAHDFVFAGRETSATGNVVAAHVAPSTNQMFVVRYDNASIIGAGRDIVLSGAFEIA